MKRMFIITLAAFMLSSCAHVISKEARSKARTDVSFGDVVKDSFMFEGSLFIWGGVIVKTRLTDEGSIVEVRQSPLDSVGEPSDTDISYGRFLVRTDRHLDPLIFEKDREITVAGVLVGSKKRRIGEATYTYPVLEAREIHLWREYIYYPPYYYDPWYYDPWYYDRWYYDPWPSRPWYRGPYKHHRHYK